MLEKLNDSDQYSASALDSNSGFNRKYHSNMGMPLDQDEYGATLQLTATGQVPG